MATDIGARKYGMARLSLIGPDQSGAANGAVTTTSAGGAGSVSVENPMLWLVGIGAVTIGLVAFSTHVRVGDFRASVSAGKD